MPEELTDVIPLCPNPRIKITDHKIAYAFTAFGMKDDRNGKDSNIIQYRSFTKKKKVAYA